MKPYTICHMIASVDGRIDCDMTEQIEGGNEYYEALEALGCPSMLMGRVTMQMHYALSEPFVVADTTPIGREAYHIARKADGYCIGVDTHGRLQWGETEFDGQALLVITDENCPKAYHDRLTEQGISWIATGENGINFARAMEILREAFGMSDWQLRVADISTAHSWRRACLTRLALCLPPALMAVRVWRQFSMA